MKSKKTSHFLSLIIPVYKKERTIVNNLRSVKIVLDKIRYDYEIIAVIDGMVDKSYEKISRARLRRVICLAYNHNHGKSFAIRLGMSKALGDYVMFLDSGAEIDPNGISMLLEHMEWYNADVIVGSKRHPASLVKYALSRKILSYGYYLIVKIFFGIRVHDTQAGIKIFKNKVLKKVLPRLLEKKFAGDLEFLVAANQLGFKRIYEAPIKLDYRIGGISNAATINEIVHIFIDTLAIWYRKNILHHYNRPAKRKFTARTMHKLITHSYARR